MTLNRRNTVTVTQTRGGASKLAAQATPATVITRQANFVIRASTRLLRVLVVDDDCDTADSLSVLLQLWGHDVRLAYGGAAALESASSERPDVLLLDVAMPTVTGLEVARQLRRQSHFGQTRIIAVSGYVDEAHRVLCTQAGFDDFLVKPLELATLEDLLNSERDQLTGLGELSTDEPSCVQLHGLYTTVDVDCRTGNSRPDEGRVACLQRFAKVRRQIDKTMRPPVVRKRLGSALEV